ncbi:MAG TPA: ATP-binding protein, partial [Methanomicrobiales archaeon]|nr:ATP-binding protein [Methanomicrobiales archaeon]
LLNLVQPQYHSSMQARMRETDERGYGSPLEMVMTRLDGESVYVEAAGSIVYQQGLPFHQVVMRDITERKRAEKQLQRLTADLRRSNEDLQRFAYVASHDLQEPLRTIVIFTQLLEKRYKGRLDKDADDYIQFIVDGGKRMQTLIEDLLQFSRVATKGKELVRTDSEDVVEKSLENLKGSIEESRAVITQDPLPLVMADPIQLQQVFQNLISNAIKFRKEDLPPRIHIGARRLDGMVEFSVQDNGIGIEAEYFDKIFVIFQRLHGPEEYPGTGIGLAVVKRIIERHGGEIWVESEPGKGSTFHFTIPAAG